MFHQSRRGTSLTLLLVASIILQTLPLRRSMVLARTLGRRETSTRTPRPVVEAAPNILLPTIGVTMADAIVNDDGDGKIDPTNGIPATTEKIEYTVTITNTGPDPATNVTYSNTIDVHTTLVTGSLSTQPITFPDAYPVTGNVNISVPNGASDLLANDVDPDTGDDTGLTISILGGDSTLPFAGTSANGGQVTSSTSDGAFTYNPPVGYTGTDTFTYTVTDPTGKTDTTTVTLTISNMVWFIDANAAVDGNGRLSNPFKFLSSFQSVNDGLGTHPKDNHTIFIYESATSYAAPVTLRNGQKFVGQDSSAALSSVSGITPAAFSAFPAVNSGNGVFVTIGSAAGGILLANGNLLRGFSLSGTAGVALQGTNFGTLSLAEVNVASNTQALSLTTGTLSGPSASTAAFGTISSGGGTNGILISSVAGTMTATGGALTGASGATFSVVGGTVSATYAGNVSQANNAAMVSVSGGHTTGTITFQTGTLNATGGTGLQFDNADSTTSYNFNGTTTLNGGDAGIDILNGSSGTFSFSGGTSITNPSGVAFNVSASNPTVTYSGSITTNANRPVSISNASAAACGAITFQTGNITANSGSNGLLVNNCNSGTITFSGPAVSLTTTTNAGVSLTNNNGASINFSGGNLDVTTTTGKAFTATGGGTVRVGGASNTLKTEGDGSPAGGMILEVTDTTIGSGGLNFLSLTGHGGSSTTRGVHVKNAGSGGLTVTGTGSTAGSGGTITNYVQQGIKIESTSNISLTNMNLVGNGTANLTSPGGPPWCGDDYNGANGGNNCAAGIDLQTVNTASLTGVHVSGGVQIGINGNNVTDLVLTTIEVNNVGNEVLEDGIQLVNLITTSPKTWTDLNLHDSASRQLAVQNSTGTNNVTINKSASGTLFFGNSTWPGPLVNSNGILWAGHGTANVTLSVQNATFTRNYGSALHSDIADSASANVTVNGGSMPDNGLLLEGGGAIGSGNFTYTLTNLTNTWADPAHTNSSMIGVLKGLNSTGTFVGNISNNQIYNDAIAGSAGPCDGCPTMIITNGGSTGTHNLTIANNTIRRTMNGIVNITSGVNVANDHSTMNVSITGNNFSTPDDTDNDLAITIVNGTDAADTTKTCANVSGNTITDPAGGGSWNSTALIRLRHVQNNQQFKLPGYAGGATDATAVANFLNGQNTLSSPDTAAAISLGPGSFVGGGACFLTLAAGGVTPDMAAMLAGVSNDNFSIQSAFGAGDQLAASSSFSRIGSQSLTNELGDGVVPKAFAASLSQEQLDSLVLEAIERWSAAGLSDRQLAAIRAIKFGLAELSGSYLGEATHNRVLIDRDAQGKGWFVDATQADDLEFGDSSSATRRYTNPFTSAAGRIDLLTAIEHEIGHRLGLDDSYEAKDRDSVMYGYLTVGERRLPAKGQGDNAKTGADASTHFLSIEPAHAIWSAATRRRFSPADAVATEREEHGDKVDSLQQRRSAISPDHVALLAAEVRRVSKASDPELLSQKRISSHAKSPGIGVRRNHAASTRGFVTMSGETVNVTIGTLAAGDSVTITYQVTLNNPPNLSLLNPARISNQGTVESNELADLLTDDTSVAGPANPTETEVDLFNTSTNLVSNPNPTNFGEQVTFTATISETPVQGSVDPTGTVDFIDTSNGNAVICNDVALTAGSAQCQTSSLTASTHNIRADYAGDGNFDPSQSNIVAQVVIACVTNPVVTKIADTNDGVCGADCSLREAVATVCPGTTITFNTAGVFSTPQTITLSLGELAVTRNVTIDAPDAASNHVTVSGGGASRVFNINSGKTVTIREMTITGGHAGSNGAVRTDGGTLTLRNSTVSGNQGGGIFIDASGSVTVTHSTISGNGAPGGGAGVYCDNTSILNVLNSTISGNNTPGSGGGIATFNGCTATITNATITNNTADSDNNSVGTGGGIFNGSGAVTLRNTIVVGNSNEDGPSDVADDISGTVDTSAGSLNNLIGTGGSGGLVDTVNGNQVGVVGAGLGLLANNGGPTQTHALLSTSPAVEGGDNTTATTAGLTTDQRGTGFPRVADSADGNTTATVDIGAYELHPSIENIGDQSTDEDTAMTPVVFNIGDGTGALISSVTATSGNTTLVPNANVGISGSGSTRTINITPAANRNSSADGTATITVTVTASNGQTAQDTFVVTVNSVNDPPSFTLGGNPPAVDEDAGAQTVNSFATSILSGPNEAGQTLSFNIAPVSTTGNLTFSSAPSIDSTTGNLTYTPSADTTGTATFSVTLSDNGSNTPPNSNTSTSQQFTITVNAINDPPSFIKGADENISENAGAQTVNGWATNLSSGLNETGQTLTFNVSQTGTTGNLTFSSPPAIDGTTGTLIYTATNGTHGSAAFDVTLSDNGSNVPPNSNTSGAQSFTITVGSVNDAPVNTAPAAVTLPRDTIFTFNGANQVSITDLDAAEAPSDGVVRASLAATNGTISLSGTIGLNFACVGCSGDGSGDTSMVFEGTIPNINTALNNLAFAPTAAYAGPASIQIVTDDMGKTGSGGVKTDTDTINITVTQPSAIYINEVLFNPPGTDAPNEYIELRGVASSTIPAGTYLVGIEGDAADNPGDVQTIINLSGLTFGTNGFLVLLQNGNTYTTNAGATVVTSTTTGFGGLSGPSGGIWSADGGATDIEHDSVSFMLIQTGVAPTLTDDIDANNDATADGSVYNGWNVRDSIGGLDGGATDAGYGTLTYALGGGGLVTAPNTMAVVGFAAIYLGRIGDSTGSTTADWTATGTLGGASPNWTLGANPEPPGFANKPLDHIGASNFVNRAPVNSVPGAQAMNEDTTLTFNAGNANLISISDTDAGTAAVKVTLTAVNGTMSLSGTAGLTFTPAGGSNDGTNDTQMVFTGTIANINAALNGMTFTPVLNFFSPPDGSITILTDDQGNTGVGGAQTDTDMVNITVGAVNDPPSFTLAGNPAAVNEDAGAQTVNSFATSISQGSGETGQTLTFNVSPTGTTGNIAFSSGPAINSATGALTYTTSTDTSGTATFSVTLSDNGSNVAPNSNTSGSQSFAITVNALNDAPSFQIPSNPPAVNEDAVAQTVNSFATSFQPGPVTATDENTQTLVGYTVTPTGTTGNLTFTSGPSISNAGTLTYTPTGNTSGTATFNVVATDSGAGTAPNVNQSAPVSFTITVNGQNDAPVIDNTGNMTMNAIDEDVAAASNTGTLVSDIIASAGGDRINDSDAGALEGMAVIAVDNTNGTWQFTIDNGTNWTPFGTPNATTARLLAANANTRVRFQPNVNFNGTINSGITFRAWDQTSGTNGNTADPSVNGGTTAFSTGTETAALTVNPINDQPAANGQVVATNEDVPLGIVLTGSDIETPSGSLTFNVTALPTNGTLTGTGANRTYTPNPDYNGPDSFKFTVTDTGDGSSGALTSIEATVTININPVNDDPVNFVPGGQSMNENTTLTFNAANSNLISIADLDAGSSAVQVQLTATNGTMTLSGTVGLTFTPANANNDGVNDATLSFSGTIANINAALNGMTFTPTANFDGPASIQILTNDLGNTGSGGAKSDTDTINITVIDGGTLGFSSATYSVVEGAGTATITVSRTGGSSGTATVQYTTSNGTAISGQDYTTASGTLTFNNGVSSQTFTVPITPDTLDEPTETVNLTLTNPGGTGALGVPSTAVLEITDDDPAPNMTINDLSVTEGNAGTTNAIFTVSLSAASGQTITVSYATANGTATAPSDYTAIPNTPVTFSPGETTKTITVVVNGDTGAEIDETFLVNLSGATNANLTDSQGLGLIISDDTPVIQFTSSTQSVNEGAGHAVITVTRLGDLSQPARISYASSDLSGLNECSQVTGIASQRCDYATVVGILRFAAGEASKDVIIPIVDDVHIEGNENFTLTLSNSVGGDVGSPNIITVTIVDNDTVPATNPVFDDAFFIRQLYIDLLGRLPEPGAVNNWLNILNNCAIPTDPVNGCDRIAVASGFLRSQEFQGRGYFVYRHYSAALGRMPLYSEFVPDMALVNGFLSGSDLEANKIAYTDIVMNRPEFKAIYDPTLGNPTAYVDTLLAKANLPNHPSRNAWIAGLTNSTLTRAQVLRQFIDSTEVYTRFVNEAFIIMNYFGFLRRSADGAYQAWFTIFNNTNDYRLIINGFMNSAEYRLRFGP